MQCYLGITLGSGQTVPCGQCIACRINKGRKWTARLMLEWNVHPVRSWFLTLTYDEHHVPRTPEGELTLRKKDALTWISNTQHKYTGKFRYYVVGEYGDRTGRPHLHMAVFPRRDSQIAEILKRWHYGHSSCGEITPQRAAYLCHYTTKKLTRADDERLTPGMEPEFRASTKIPPIGAPALPLLVHPYRRGAGKKLAEERGDVERSVRIGGKVYPLDGYLLGKMRSELGIPLTHTGRIDANPNYLVWHETQEASWDPKINEVQKVKYAEKAKINATRRVAL